MPKKIELTAENKCSHCYSSKCCQYVTQALDTPKSIRDFDHLLWQVSHRNVQAFKDEDGWFLLFVQPCTHLQNDGRCGIYDTRPFICREHENDYCEFDTPLAQSSELFFHDDKELDQYCRKRFKRWEKRFM